ncbi:hypothetical protein LL240_09795 [Oceanimonas baumannii]|uniref:hypothetical protein n=1 Tax=Oceanimonas baumannii TaxID=129578 RepID=UPI001D1944DE|nr:hypothetical protein [Oceanimonas baumannii]MCC4264747.1 hypothetical protein [Oceanimonas baumannii]
MGFWSSVRDFFSDVGSAIGRSVSAIGSALSSFAKGIGTVIGGVVEALAPVAKAIGNFANAFLQGLGILKPNESVEDMGNRALQAADEGITMDKFDDFNSYMNALRDFEPDPEKSKSYSPNTKLVAGLGVGTKGVEEKFNAEPGSLDAMWLLPMANPEYFTPERMQGLISAGRLGSDTFDYLEKRLTGGESRTFEKALEVDKSGNVMDAGQRGELYDALENAQDNWSNMMDKIDGSKQ